MNRNRKSVRISESQIRSIVAESVRRVIQEEDEEMYMSDEDIHSQYEGFRILQLQVEKVERFRFKGFDGAIEIEFPNADEIDYDSTVVDNFIVYDENATQIAFDRWYPSDVYNRLCSAIRAEIRKKYGNI